MQYQPKKHQQIAAEFLETHPRSALFLDMGLGKTVIALTWMQRHLNAGTVSKFLVIAPKRVAEDTWSRETAKWDHLSDLRISKILGDRKAREAAVDEDADIYVINRENVQWLVENYGKTWPFDGIVIDELSSFKSATSQRFRHLRRILPMTTVFLGLTGTPMPNGYLDLWPQLYLIDQGATLGKTLSSYKDTYFIPGASKGYVVYEWRLRSGAKQRIDMKLQNTCLSMSKDDWLDLPPIIYNEVPCRMSKKEREVYDQMKEEQVLPLFESKVATVEDMETAVIGETAAVLSNKLLQMANGAVYDNEGNVFCFHDRKLDVLEELVESAQGKPILVFYSYKHDLDRIRKRFPEARKLETSQDITDWNNAEIPILLCHPASAGHGLNLQEGGHIIVWFGLPWSLELYQQANARLYRQGQTESVIVHHIICEDTLDSKVLMALQSKDSTQRSMLNALKSYMKGNING